MTLSTSRAGKVWRGILFGVGALGLAALAVFAYLRYWPRETPEGQAPLQTMTQEKLLALKENFNAASEETRVVALLSPT